VRDERDELLEQIEKEAAHLIDEDEFGRDFVVEAAARSIRRLFERARAAGFVRYPLP